MNSCASLIPRLSVVKAGPVLVCALNPRLGFLQELSLNALAVVQIQFPLNDLPSLGVNVNGVTLAHAVGAVPAVLGRVLLRVLCEKIPVLSGRELPDGAAPCRAELRVPYRTAFLSSTRRPTSARCARRRGWPTWAAHVGGALRSADLGDHAGHALRCSGRAN